MLVLSAAGSKRSSSATSLRSTRDPPSYDFSAPVRHDTLPFDLSRPRRDCRIHALPRRAPLFLEFVVCMYSYPPTTALIRCTLSTSPSPSHVVLPCRLAFATSFCPDFLEADPTRRGGGRGGLPPVSSFMDRLSCSVIHATLQPG